MAELLLYFCALLALIAPITADIPDNSVFFAAKSDTIYFINNTEAWISGNGTNPVLVPCVAYGDTCGFKVKGRSKEGIDLPLCHRVKTNMKSGLGLAYDYHLRAIILSDPGFNSIFLLNASSYQGIFYHFGTSNGVGQLCVDWRGHNIYWTDSVYGWIAMQKLPPNILTHNSLQTSFKLVVERYLHTPTGIVVHPLKHYLFWADAGPQPKIERSDLIGGGRKIIMWAGLIAPTSLCIDQSSGKLYWTDPKRGTVEYSDLEGQNRNILISNPEKDFYGIAVFKNTLIVTVPSQNSIEMYDNSTGESQSSLNDSEVTLFSILIYNPLDQPRHQIEECDEFGCDHICTHMEQERGYTCLCDDGYDLDPDGETCADSNVLERFLLYTSGTSICGISINVINIPYKLLTPSCDIIKHTKPITKFALDMVNNVIMYTDGTDIFKDQAFGNDPEHIGSSGDVSDLDFNWKSKELIWADKTEGKIYAINIEDYIAGKQILQSELDTPTSVAVNPHARDIYWVSKEETVPVIHVMGEDRSVSKLGTSLLNDPADLEYDRLHGRLIWSDRRGHVGFINVDGTRENSINIPNKRPEAVSVFKTYILCSDAEMDSNVLSVIQEPDELQWSILNTSLNATNINDIHVFETSLQPSDLEHCEENNGDCDHLCLPLDNNRCECNIGYYLDTDGTSCTTNPSESNFFLVSDTMYQAVYQIDMESDKIYAINMEESNKPASLSFDSDNNIVYWIDTRSRSLKLNEINGGKERSLGIDVDNTSSIAVDVTAGNVYVTKHDEILLFTHNGVKTLLQRPEIKGRPGKIAVKPSSGLMVWTESGPTKRIVKANMDGTTIKEVATEIGTLSDIAIDHYTADNIMFWCNLKMIERVDLDTLTRQQVYHNKDLQIIAIDVKEEDLYFLAEGRRQIYRIDKTTGGGYQVVKKSALFGTLSTLYVWKPPPRKHDLCGDCNNGGCSSICLPRREGRTCACADSISLRSDSKTCSNVDPCDTSLLDSKIESLDRCCVPVSDRSCDYTCKLGYEKQPYPLFCKPNGRWNLSLAAACVKPAATSPPDNNIGMYAGVGVGTSALVVVVIAVLCVYRRSKQKQHTQNPLPSNSSRTPVYDDPNGILSQDPPRRLTNEEQADGGVYNYIDESMIAKTVDLPPEGPNKGKRINTGSQDNERYSKFPPYEETTTKEVFKPPSRRQTDTYYLTPYPAPDYDTKKKQDIVQLPLGASRNDGFMMPVSFSRKGQNACLPSTGFVKERQTKLKTGRKDMFDIGENGYMCPTASDPRGYHSVGYMSLTG